MTKENKDKIKKVLFEGFRAKEITFSKGDEKLNDDTYLTKYVNGLLDNWIRKNPEFNNGQKYVTQNPGSRAGSQDETIKALRALLKQTENASDRADIQEAIKDRLAEIRPKTVVEINADAIPEHLKHLVPSSN